MVTIVNLQESSNSETSDLKVKLAQSINDLKSMESERELLLIDVDRMRERTEQLQDKMQHLEDTLTEERSQNVNIQKELNK